MANEINIDALNNVFKSLNNSSDSLKQIVSNLSAISNETEVLNTTCMNLSNTLTELSSSLNNLDFMTTTTFIFTLIDGLGNLSENLDHIGKLFTVTFKSFSLSLGPVAIGFGLVMGALALFGDSIDMSSKKTQENIKILEKKKTELDNVTESLKKNTEATKENISGIQGDFAVTLSYVDELQSMSKNGGLAENMEKAKFMVEQINSVLPDSVSITEEGTLAWKGSAEEIRKNLELLEKKAIVEAKQADFAEAMKNRTKLQVELTSATSAYNDALTRQKNKKDEIDDAIKNGQSTEKLVKEYQDLVTESAKYKEVLDSSKNAMAANDDVVNDYKASLNALDGTVESNAKALLESYGEVSSYGSYTYTSLAKGLMDLNEKEKQYNEGKLQLSEEEIKINERTRQMVIDGLFEKAKGFGDSYDKMVETLESRGVYLTELEKEQLEERFGVNNVANKAIEELQASHFGIVLEQLESSGIILDEKEKEHLAKQYQNWDESAKGKEGIQALSLSQLITNLEQAGIMLTSADKKHLKEQYDAWQQNATDKEITLSTSYSKMKEDLNTLMTGMNEDQRTKLNESIDILSKGGSEGGLELCNKLAQSLKDNDGKITEETQDIIDDVNEMAKNANPTMNVGAAAPGKYTLASIASNIKSGIGDIKVPMGFNLIQTVLSIAGFGHDITLRASGGFPDTGELFIAREAGPELVGRINGKTAVANNDQIVSGISNGVYNAMKSVMQTNGSTNNMNLHATFVMDGEVVGKQVIQYHNGVVRRTGTTPLLI